ncbi:MAG: glutathione S-transferase N-terminal domain-containing protein [Bdellovibrionales bacterium]|nr:glutathione S-transferase N-terminal domain-containing protein [Bdellovibrionales bacterium]
MKLYYSPGACSLAAHIVLEELQIPFELELINFRELPEGYLNIRPLGGVPALVTDDNTVFTEGAAILQYLGDRKPELKLTAAHGTPARYQLIEVLNFLATELHKAMGVFFALPRMSQNPTTIQEARTFYAANLQKRITVVAKKLDQQPYIAGDHYTVADAYLFTLLSWAKAIQLDLSPWPVLGTYQARIRERPAVLRALKTEHLS